MSRRTITSRQKWWLGFGAAAMLAGIALAWISVVVLRLEADAQHQQMLRMALWRMDGWMGQRLRVEATRAYFEYLPFYPHDRAYTRILNAIEPGEVYSPSPLLMHESEHFPLHFQVDGTGTISSPQVPQGNWRDLAESGYVSPDAIERKQPFLESVVALLGPRSIEACVSASETTLSAMLGDEDGINEEAPFVPNSPPQQLLQSQGQAQKVLSKADLQWRMNSNYNNPAQEGLSQSVQIEETESMRPTTVTVGMLMPLWLGNSAGDSPPSGGPETMAISQDLLFVRRVRVGNDTLYQGVLADWPRLRATLLQQIVDLFPRADLTPVPDPTPGDAESGRMLGSIPVRLAAECPALAAGSLITPARTALATMWLAALGAIVASATTLRASIAYGERRSRFASAVTHELRTPLTTFRMYSEMLAQGMVRDESQRAVYLHTLQSESARLSALVENVLSFARLEQGRARSLPQSMTLDALIERIVPDLERRASSCGMSLVVKKEGGEQPLRADADAIGQILFNLVDNACKYAAGGDSTAPVIEIDFCVRAGQLQVVVSDHGPGIDPEHAKIVFKPFERGAHLPGDAIPGVGLGLALARGLARDMGGDLVLLSPAAPGVSRGAAFRLVLPVA